MSVGEITMTLDDVSCLLHLPPGASAGINLMVRLLGSESFDANTEVTMTKGAHARTTYLKALFKTHLQRIEEFTEDEESVEKHQNYALRVYLLLLVGYTIFADTSKNSVHLHYLRYFDDLLLVFDYAWGLAHLLQALSN
ncbi:serine/threonine-protein phosphatase 7 long form-like protein, partial [Trifolium medium]|nr:serine/threonine-protein phosphatase 7 long form-like protein [Trifolium medium]